MGTYVDKVQRYFPLTAIELRNLVISILIIGFMFGFDDGRADFNIAYYSYNMIVSVAVVALTMIVFISGQRFAALSAGYRAEFQMWWPGLIGALILTFLISPFIPGHIYIPIAGGMVIHHMAGHRLGFFRYGINMLDNGIIAASGPLACVAFATILKQFVLWFPIFPNEAFVTKIYWFMIYFALINMIPIPPLAGSKLMYNSRLPFVFIFSFILVYTVLAYFNVFSWVLALIGAFVLWISYYLKFDKA